MKILVKCNQDTHILQARGIFCHIDPYWVYLHYDCWKELGHEVAFYSEKPHEPEITDKHEGYDVLFVRGYTAMRYETGFLLKTLKEFKGKKILYLEAQDEHDIGQYFDLIIIPDSEPIADMWRKKYPNKEVRVVPWTSVRFDFIDKDITSPYPDDGKYRIIYAGIVIKRYLDNMIKLAEMGENIVFGGMYYDGKICRKMTDEEVGKLPPNIQLISTGSLFQVGDHFRYLRHADLGIGFISFGPEYKDIGSLSSKIIEYINCGLPVVCEGHVPNRKVITDLNAGTIVEWDNFDSLYAGIQAEKALKRDKKGIMDRARAFHDPHKICEDILKW